MLGFHIKLEPFCPFPVLQCFSLKSRICSALQVLCILLMRLQVASSYCKRLPMCVISMSPSSRPLGGCATAQDLLCSSSACIAPFAIHIFLDRGERCDRQRQNGNNWRNRRFIWNSSVSAADQCFNCGLTNHPNGPPKSFGNATPTRSCILVPTH